MQPLQQRGLVRLQHRGLVKSIEVYQQPLQQRGLVRLQYRGLVKSIEVYLQPLQQRGLVKLQYRGLVEASRFSSSTEIQIEWWYSYSIEVS